jgi:hypothetical protein
MTRETCFWCPDQYVLGVVLLVVDNDPVLDSPPVELTHLIQDCGLDQFVDHLVVRSFWIMVEWYRANQAGLRAQANLSVYFEWPGETDLRVENDLCAQRARHAWDTLSSVHGK